MDSTSAHGSASRSSLSLSTIRPRDVGVNELEELLHRRLRAAILIFLAAALAGLVIGYFEPEMLLTRPWRFVTGTVFFGLMAAWLFTRTKIPLKQLRIAEVILFGAATISLTLNTSERLAVSALAFPEATEASRRTFAWILESCSLYWWFLIVLYGIFIPNTGRRCATVVGGLALAALGLTALRGLANPVLGHALFGGLFLLPIFWISTAAAIAIFGSSRINLLATSLAAVRTLGPYRVLRKLGSGAMGEVYLAEHQLLDRPCAIKVVRPERAGDPAVLLRFEREVRVMAQLTHWNIVEIFDTGYSQDGMFYFAMEYLPGLSLQELVDENGPLPAPRAIHLLTQICAALADVHAAGLVHRDLKPANIIVCRRGCSCDVVKLLDFGIVQLNSGSADAQLTTEGKFLGTPLYVSPEQIRAREALDGRSDIYSLGATAYFLLTGEAPFIRQTVPEILTAHLREPVVMPSQLESSIPSDLEAMVVRCLEKEPGQRYASVLELRAALSRCGSAGQWKDDQAEAWWLEHRSEEVSKTAESK